MSISLKKIWPLLLILSFLIQRVISSIEANTVILTGFALVFLILKKGKINSKDFNLLSFLILIVLIGLFSTFFNKPSFYDFIRDLIYFIKPLVLIFLGYFVSKIINDWKIVFKSIIYLGLGYAVFHIVHTIIYTDFSTASVSKIRDINGLSNIVELYAIALIVLAKTNAHFNVFKKRSTLNLVLIVLSFSFVLYFSRTMIVGLLFLILGVLNYLKLNKKGVKYLTLVLFFFIALYTYLFNTEINRKGNALETFLYKLKMAPSEIFTPKLDLKNHEDLWDHWRAYEAYCAIKSLNETPINYINGKGLGALIDLKFAAPLSSDGNLRYIPILHNGYVFILYKTGILGLLFYILFLVQLYYQAYSKTKNIETKTFSNLLSATALYLMFSSLIITGLYNLQEETAIFLGVFLFLKSNSKIKS